LLLKRLIGLALLLAGGTLLAQPNAPTSPADAMGSADMQAAIIAGDKDIVRDTGTVIALQLRARKDKDVVRLTCINDKLLQIKALRNIFDQLRVSFEASGKQEDFSQIVSTQANVRQLREQAQICAGETQFVSDTQTGYSGPDIPDDPSKDLFPTGPEQPGYASPYN
jgi:hypothetical protein